MRVSPKLVVSLFIDSGLPPAIEAAKASRAASSAVPGTAAGTMPGEASPTWWPVRLIRPITSSAAPTKAIAGQAEISAASQP